jgi:hypothetical protein
VIKFYVLINSTLYAYPLFSININNENEFGFILLIFPIVALLTSCIGWWHIRSESDRFKVVSNKYNEIRGPENRPEWLYPKNKKRNLRQQLISEDMNGLILYLYSILSFIFFLFGTLLIIDKYYSVWEIPKKIYSISLIIPAFSVIHFFIKYNKKKKEHNSNINSDEMNIKIKKE